MKKRLKFQKSLAAICAATLTAGCLLVPVYATEPAVMQIAESEYVITSNGTYQLGAAPVLMTMRASTQTIQGGSKITANGVYQLASNATGVISVAKGVTDVTIIGNGADWEKNTNSNKYGTVYSTPNENLSIDCSAASGVTLTLKNAYISNSGVEHNLINFSGKNNTLIFDGTVILDHDNGALGYASIRVPSGSSLNIKGTTDSHAYLYKSEQAAGIGGNTGEACGAITFGVKGGANDFYVFMKGSKQGAVIGNGSNCSAVPGNITFHSGVYNLLGVARGAIISGSAGVSSKDAGNVFVNGGLINMNVDYSGAAIGGGGYSSGNDKGGGALYVSGGSIRTYIDSNAVGNWESYGVTQAGVNDAAITAARLNGAGEDVFLLTVDTTGLSDSSFTIKVDGSTYYTGPRYSYCYYKEDVNRDTNGDGYADVSTTPNGTPGNWIALNERCFYLYVTGEDHVVSVNGKAYQCTWNKTSQTFTMKEAADVCYGDVTGDGKVNNIDAGRIYAYVNGKTALNADQQLVADVNGDGKITNLDASMIYAYQNNKLSSFPVEQK